MVLTCGVSVLASGREQKHGNVIGIFQIVQKFSKKAKYAEIGFDIQIFREILCLRTSH